jgi:predicted GIY-YIG superfamily endonuclease
MFWQLKPSVRATAQKGFPDKYNCHKLEYQEIVGSIKAAMNRENQV